jgi:SAM-dependent methyltransferase
MAERSAWQGHAGVALDMANGFTVIDCDACRFKHIVPIPTPKELADVYGHQYYSTEKPLYIERHIEDLEWWNVVYAERYDLFERLLPEERRRLIDIGSGPGYFLLHGRKRGWNVRGVEPSRQAASHSRGLGLDIVEAFLNDQMAATLGTYDVAHMNEVLEHVPDPRRVLQLVNRLLEPGGLVSLMVPNDYSPFQAALRDACGLAPWWVAPPHHINYFDVDSVQRLLNERFEVVSLETTFPIDLFLLMGDNYIGNDQLGRACHARRKTFELNLARAGRSGLKQDVYRSLAKLGVGRDIVVTARKRDAA